MSFVARVENTPPWAQDLPEGWRTDWLKWSVEFASAKSEDTEDGAAERLPYISNEDIASWTGKLLKEQPEPVDKDGRLFRRGDVLFNKLRPYLAKVYLAEFEGIGSGELLNLRASDRILPRFLFYVLSSSAFIDTINAETFGTKMPRADWETVGHQPLPLPDLDTQRRIAQLLDDKTARIDALIERKRALLDRLAEKRQALITRAVTCGHNPTAPLRDSGVDWLGKIPAHWECWPIKRYLTEREYGISEALSESGAVAILRMGNIQGLELDLSELKYVEEVEPFLLLRENDVLFNRTNSIDLVGKSAIYRGNFDGDLSFASYLARFRFDPRYLPEFANYVFGTEQLLAYARTMALRAIGQANLNPSRFAEIPVPVPPIEEQRQIAQFLRTQGEKIEEVRQKISASIGKLTEYRAALVTAAVTGKITSLLIDKSLKPAKKEAPAAFKRSVLAAYIADTLCDHPTFGRVKFQKLLHLSEAHLAIEEVEGNYYRDAAGPFDTQMMRSVHSQLARQSWIMAEERKGGKGTSYRRGDKVQSYKSYFDRYFGDRQEAIDDLLALLRAAGTQQVEIVSTAFAAWNDLLLEGKTPTDDEIVELILNDWTDSKRKIAPERWRRALDWMRTKKLVPRGLGRHTKKKAVER
ncbi:MAG: hypothetical protein AMXMBFR74_09120 [Parvibaculum sp.]|uniref:restriction endonuclease subunit S n=1 Tax=Parvibaculum sp. TaxID=2024848 RepID=UPI0035B8E4AC